MGFALRDKYVNVKSDSSSRREEAWVLLNCGHKMVSNKSGMLPRGGKSRNSAVLLAMLIELIQKTRLDSVLYARQLKYLLRQLKKLRARVVQLSVTISYTSGIIQIRNNGIYGQQSIEILFRPTPSGPPRSQRPTFKKIRSTSP